MSSLNEREAWAILVIFLSLSLSFNFLQYQTIMQGQKKKSKSSINYVYSEVCKTSWEAWVDLDGTLHLSFIGYNHKGNTSLYELVYVPLGENFGYYQDLPVTQGYYSKSLNMSSSYVAFVNTTLALSKTPLEPKTVEPTLSPSKYKDEEAWTIIGSFLMTAVMFQNSTEFEQQQYTMEDGSDMWISIVVSKTLPAVALGVGHESNRTVQIYLPELNEKGKITFEELLTIGVTEGNVWLEVNEEFYDLSHVAIAEPKLAKPPEES